MLIQTGKAEGWLHLSAGAVQAWASVNGINFRIAAPGLIPGRGLGLLAQKSVTASADNGPCRILDIPQDLVLSIEAVRSHASFDRDLRELLDSIADFAQTPRGAILTFLLFQASLSSPHLSESIGVHGPFKEYVRSLPCELLPTFWRPEELQLLVGTTLAPAISSKLKSLRREYDLLCASAQETHWYRTVQSFLSFDDWLQVDAMFRSRALEFHGSCMIPGMDLASHAPGELTTAFYDRDMDEGMYFLNLIEGKSLQAGEEVTITYGDEKGACEMLFSYGFIDDDMQSAQTLFLGLSIPGDDVASAAKMNFAACAPGFKLIDTSQTQNNDQDRGFMPATETTTVDTEKLSVDGVEIDWDGDFVWLLCVGSDDGLRFALARTVDGNDQELQASFDGEELEDGARGLRRLLGKSDMWPVYKLRAIVILQQRVLDQLQLLYSSQEDAEAVPHGGASEVRQRPYELIMQLRQLEFELLEKAYADFEKQKIALADTAIVQEYLERMTSEAAPIEVLDEDDFS